MSRQTVRAALRETKKQFEHQEKIQARLAKRNALRAKRRENPRRASGYIKTGGLFRP